MTDGTAGFLVRPARDGDLDVIAGFEIDIARASFGDEAIEDPALHRKRVAGALGKPGEVTLVAVAAKGQSEEGMGRRAGGGGDGAPVGWAPGTATSGRWPPPTSRAAASSLSC
jgi:hypothetical protein